VRSPPLSVVGLTDEIRDDKDRLKVFSDEHQGRMKNVCDIPAFLKAVELIADGRVAVDDERVYVDGTYFPNGVEMG